MTYFYLYLFEISILFLLNRAFNITLLTLINKKVKNEKTILYIIYIFYWPSILFHETAHFMAAKLMFLPIKKVSLIPKLEGDKFNLGHVRFESGGQLRNFVASSAPFWLGNITLFFVIQKMLTLPFKSITCFLLALIVFQLANALVLSWPDIKSALIIYVIIAILIFFISIGLITLNFRSEMLVNYFLLMDKYLLVPIAINTIFVILMRVVL